MSEDFVATVSKAGAELTFNGSGDSDVASGMLRRAFPGAAVSVQAGTGVTDGMSPEERKEFIEGS